MISRPCRYPPCVYAFGRATLTPCLEPGMAPVGSCSRDAGHARDRHRCQGRSCSRTVCTSERAVAPRAASLSLPFSLAVTPVQHETRGNARRRTRRASRPGASWNSGEGRGDVPPPRQGCGAAPFANTAAAVLGTRRMRRLRSARFPHRSRLRRSWLTPTFWPSPNDQPQSCRPSCPASREHLAPAHRAGSARPPAAVQAAVASSAPAGSWARLSFVGDRVTRCDVAAPVDEEALMPEAPLAQVPEDDHECPARATIR